MARRGWTARTGMAERDRAAYSKGARAALGGRRNAARTSSSEELGWIPNAS